MDPASRDYINRSQLNLCMREFACDHFRPKPNLPGLPWYKANDSDSENEGDDERDITWVVEEQQIATGSACGCSAKCCREDPEKAIGLLTDAEWALILHHMKMLAIQTGSDQSGTPSTSIPTTSSSTLQCSKPEREILRQALTSWRDAY